MIRLLARNCARWPTSSIKESLRGFHVSYLLKADGLNAIPIDRTRNIGIIAHIDAGKTTTTERMLFYSGKTVHIGNVDEGDTVTDYLPSERERGITIQSAATTIEWNRNKINIIDTPGHADFTFEVIRSLRVLDGCVTILDGVAGVEAQTEKVWKQANSLGIPKIVYVNKMDREGAGYSRSVKELIEKFHTKAVLCNVPFFEIEKSTYNFKGVIDVVNKVLLLWDPILDPTGRKITVHDVEKEKDIFAEAYDIVQKSRESMVETLGEFDDGLVEAFLELEGDYMKIDATTLNKSIRNATIKNQVTPVLCGSSFKNIGVQPLMDAIVSYLPSPLEINIPAISASSRRNKKQTSNTPPTININMDPKKGLVINSNHNLSTALAFKVITHPTRGVMTFFRVYSGKLLSNSVAINTRTKKKINLKKLLLMHGEEPQPVGYISSGNIGVISGSEDEIRTGDTLVSIGSNKQPGALEQSIQMLPIEIPPPLFNSSLEPLTAGDLRYMNECLTTLLREDPSLSITTDDELGQTIISGMGELHLEIVRDRLLNDMKAKIKMRDVAISYKETLSNPTGHALHLSHDSNPEISVEIELHSMSEDGGNSTFMALTGATYMEQDNNMVAFDENSTPEHVKTALFERRWKCECSLEEIEDNLIKGCNVGLQLGGPILGLPLHSIAVIIKKWDFPVERALNPTPYLLEIARQVVEKYIKESLPVSSFTVLEPLMSVKVTVSTDHIGEVVHDLTQRCQAVVTSIEDDLEDLDATNNVKNVSDKMYFPEDHTLSSANLTKIHNKKIVHAEAPLRDMIGYLSKLRSLTQGRATFDMTYKGMRSVPNSKLKHL